MSNTYDIDIQMNYFLSGDDYDSSLKSLQEFKEITERHLSYWEEICSSKERYIEEWDQFYGDERNSYKKHYLNDPCQKGMEGENYHE